MRRGLREPEGHEGVRCGTNGWNLFLLEKGFLVDDPVISNWRNQDVDDSLHSFFKEAEAGRHVPVSVVSDLNETDCSLCASANFLPQPLAGLTEQLISGDLNLGSGLFGWPEQTLENRVLQGLVLPQPFLATSYPRRWICRQADTNLNHLMSKVMCGIHAAVIDDKDFSLMKPDDLLRQVANRSAKMEERPNLLAGNHFFKSLPGLPALLKCVPIHGRTICSSAQEVPYFDEEWRKLDFSINEKCKTSLPSDFGSEGAKDFRPWHYVAQAGSGRNNGNGNNAVQREIILSGFRGLTNLGGSCYMNAALQILRSLREVHYFLLTRETSTGDTPTETFSNEFSAIAYTCELDWWTVVHTRPLASCITDSLRLPLRKGAAATEAFKKFLNALGRNAADQRIKFPHVHSTKFLKLRSMPASPFFSLFTGIVKNYHSCTCKSFTVYTTFNHLYLEVRENVQQEDVTTFLLNTLSGFEENHVDTCGDCRRKNKTIEREIVVLPQYIVVIILNSKNGKLVQTPINFSEDVSVSTKSINKDYKWRGITYHHEDPRDEDSAHATAVVRSLKNGAIVHCDDENLTLSLATLVPPHGQYCQINMIVYEGI